MNDSRSRTSTGRMMAIAVAAIAVIMALPQNSRAASPEGTTGGALPNSAAKSTLVQDPDLVAAKDQGLLRVDANRRVTIATTPIDGVGAAASYPVSKVLSTSVTGMVVEPEHNGYDDAHHSYTDTNYWNFCAAGAAAIGAYYWSPSYLTYLPADYYNEPYGSHHSNTYWRASDTGTSADTGNGYATQGRGYLMYMAEVIKPPSYSNAGIDEFNHYPTHGGTLPDIRDALNWEFIAEDPAWWNANSFFWAVHSVGSQASLVTNVKTDVGTWGVPVVIDVQTYLSPSVRLPNWTRSLPGSGHTITIIGWNDSTQKFTYLDTCSQDCNGSSGNHNGGTYSVLYSTMFALMQNFGQGYVY